MFGVCCEKCYDGLSFQIIFENLKFIVMCFFFFVENDFMLDEIENDSEEWCLML